MFAFCMLLVCIFTKEVICEPIIVLHRDTPGCPRIISRSEWKARNATGPYEPLIHAPTPYVVVHHGGSHRYCYNQSDCSAVVRSYQNHHIDVRHWIDIGYNFVIGEDGNVYEGRGWDYVGAHAPKYNNQSIGICVIGDFSESTPNELALEALKSLMSCGVQLYKISKQYNTIGHRQVRDTSCPGQTFYNWIQKLPSWTDHPTPLSSTIRSEITSTIISTTTSISTAMTTPAAGNVPDDEILHIITRSEWGARQATKAATSLTVNPPTYVIIHHSDTNGCYSQATCQQKVRSFQNLHINVKHWDDIAYNFLVGEDGNVYEGRGWGVKGAHSRSYNTKSIGICVIGNFNEQEPRPAAINAIEKLIAHAVSSGNINSTYTIYGHRQISSTLSPGEKLYAIIKSWPHWQNI